MEEAIIVFVEKNDFLYNKTHRNYKNYSLRDQKFNELAHQLKIPVGKIKSRWRTLRDKFFKEIKYNKTSLSGSTRQKKRWKWMDHLMFLKKVNTVNERATGNFSALQLKEDNFYLNLTNDFTTISNSTECDIDIEGAPLKATTNTTDSSGTKSSLSDFSLNESSCSCSSGTTKSSKSIKSDMLDSTNNQFQELIKISKNGFTAREEPTRTASRLFFDSIAQQIEEAYISPHDFRKLQMGILKVVNDILDKY